mmetsp:Transcript_35499/g.101372  ORF Transcript_35499/g.101372 Transcript_35499/m.101372 type:complete len:289 (+) Transcript_35499:79-945(+)
MFTLAVIDDDIPVHPADFGGDFKVTLREQIQNKYVDRVIPNVGLCIEFWDFNEIKDAHIHPGDGKMSCGEAYFKVEFSIIVFRPMLDEWLVGSIAGSSQRGLSVSLGFFADVEIPSSNLRTPYMYDAAHEMWVWQYRSSESFETINFFYKKDELVRFRVTAVHFPEPTGPKGPRHHTPMQIVGAVDRDGLGCVSWWPDTARELMAAKAAGETNASAATEAANGAGDAKSSASNAAPAGDTGASASAEAAKAAGDTKASSSAEGPKAGGDAKAPASAEPAGVADAGEGP